jgi:hydroxypyruvate reductase 1
MASHEWKTHNPDGRNRVVVTKDLPGDRWLQVLIRADCRVEICMSTDVLSVAEIKAAVGSRCDAVIGQLTETWGDKLFASLKAAGGRAYSNYAVGYNNVDVAAAARLLMKRPWLPTAARTPISGPDWMSLKMNPC